MEPEQQNNTPEEVVETPPENNLKEQLTTVTPLSKYLAILLFIAMPFIGAWIGYTYAPEKVVEVEKVAEVEPMPEPEKVEDTNYSFKRIECNPRSYDADYYETEKPCENDMTELDVERENDAFKVLEQSDVMYRIPALAVSDERFQLVETGGMAPKFSFLVVDLAAEEITDSIVAYRILDRGDTELRFIGRKDVIADEFYEGVYRYGTEKAEVLGDSPDPRVIDLVEASQNGDSETGVFGQAALPNYDLVASQDLPESFDVNLAYKIKSQVHAQDSVDTPLASVTKDGTTVYYVGTDGFLYAHDVVSGSNRKLTDSKTRSLGCTDTENCNYLFNSAPRISPSNRYIAIRSQAWEGYNVYVYDALMDEIQNFNSLEYYLWHPTEDVFVAHGAYPGIATRYGLFWTDFTNSSVTKNGFNFDHEIGAYSKGVPTDSFKVYSVEFTNNNSSIKFSFDVVDYMEVQSPLSGVIDLDGTNFESDVPLGTIYQHIKNKRGQCWPDGCG